MSNATTEKIEKISLLRVLGPAHVWALGVGIVLVGEYMAGTSVAGRAALAPP